MFIFTDDHISMSSGNDIQEICQPLFDFCEINYFELFRIYKDESRLVLGTRPDWIRYAYQKPPTSITGFQSTDFNSSSLQRICTWSDLPSLVQNKELATMFSNIILKDARNEFNITDCITIVEFHNDYQDYFNFGTTRNNNIMKFYFNNLDILERFIIYFKEKAALLIIEAEKSKFLLTPPPCQNTNMHSYNNLNNIRGNKFDFIEKTQVKKLNFSGNLSGIYLTTKELDCLALHLKGETAKSAARKLNISPRTFEKHLEAIKSKLNIKSKILLLNLIELPEIKKYFNILS